MNYYILRFLIVFVLGVIESRCNFNENEDDLLLLVSENQKTPLRLSCITNSTGALTLHKPMLMQYSTAASRYIPNPIENAYDCSMKFLIRCNAQWRMNNGYWKPTKSIESEDFEQIVLDRRWDDFYYLDNKGKSFPFQDYLLPSKTKFIIPLSVKATCLAFLKITFNKISSYEIFLSACNATDSRVVHPDNHSEPLNQTFSFDDFTFAHFKFIRDGNYSIFTTGSGDQIFKHFSQLPDGLEISIVNRGNNVWKIHNYIYLKSTVRNSLTTPPIQPMNGSICVSIFLAGCLHCSFKFNLLRRDTILQQSTSFTPKENKIWEEFKFEFKDLDTVEHSLSISTISDNHDIADLFWAIGDTRICQTVEFRILTDVFSPAFKDANMTDLECEVLKPNKTLQLRPHANNSVPLFDGRNNSTLFGIDCAWFTQEKYCTHLDVYSIRGAKNTASTINENVPNRFIFLIVMNVFFVISIIAIVIIIISRTKKSCKTSQ